MRLPTCLGAALLAILAACGDMGKDLRALFAISSGIQSTYGVAANVSINNGTHLVITIADERAYEMDEGAREALARRVATYARRHYPSAGRLTDIRVNYQRVTSAGPVTVTRTGGGFHWAPSELGVDSAAAEATTAAAPAAVTP